MINAKFKLTLNIASVVNHAEKKRSAVLYRTGAYGLSVMRRSIRPPKSGRKARTVTVDGRECLVPVVGKVLDSKSKKPVSKKMAESARRAITARLRDEGAGKPPHRGPRDLLRRGMNFQVDGESVVIGAMPFVRQPKLSGVVSVPQLLEQGGGEVLRHQLYQYQPRPFVQPAMETTQRKMAELIESLPL